MGITMRAFEQMRAERDSARQESDQSAALVGEAKKALEAIIRRVALVSPFYEMARAVVDAPPPAALARVQREAAAKALEEQVDRLRSMGTEGASAYAIARNTAVAEMIVDITKRAAELREGK